MSDDAVRTEAKVVLRRTARALLRPVGLAERGRSGRHWIDDHGWWLVNVSLDAGSGAVVSHLNVGRQYLWYVSPNFYYEYESRRRSDRFDDVDLNPWQRAIEAQAGEVVSLVAEYRTRLSDPQQHLRALVDGAHNAINHNELFNGACAAGLLHEPALAVKLLARHSDDRDTPWVREFKARAERLAKLVQDPPALRDALETAVKETRQTLGLPPLAQVLPPA
jgi:hypothetical protein